MTTAVAHASAPPAAAPADDVVTVPRWFGAEGHPMCGWWSTPGGATVTSAVVILPPIGYEYWSAHRTLRTLAERLVARGHGAFRVDFDGNGDSAGERWDAGRVAAWRRTVRDAVAEVRALGAQRVILMGLRLGASLALVEAAACDVDSVIAWVPVTSGKKFMRELRMLGLAVQPSVERPEPGDAVVYAGVVFTAETAADLGAIDLDKLPARPAPRALVVARPDRPNDKLAARLAELGTETTLETLPGAETALDIPAEGAEVPHAILDAIVGWVGDAPPVTDTRPEPIGAIGVARPSARIEWHGGELTEEVIALGPLGLTGMLGAPLGAHHDTTVVFLNSGAEPHTGPGRCWVEYTRELNLRGYRTVRVDFSGWGESPDHGHAPGTPYDGHCVGEAVAMTEALHALGHERVVMSGLCAGAWIAMRAALTGKIDAVLAINPQLYWFPGCPLDARINEAIERRAPDRKREIEGAASGYWSVLDVLGLGNYGARWLTQLAEVGTPTLMLFAEGDDGLGYLHNRLGRRLKHALAPGSIKLWTIPDIDHQMYREWRRADVVAKMAEYLALLG
jgi:pimeloyl-ACP methyl ester carboxylesterase